MATVKGKWLFNDTLTDPTGSNGYAGWTVSFTSHGQSFKSISCNHGEASSFEIYYGGQHVGNVATPEGDALWYGEAYRLIDFGSTEQDVVDDFYSWLTENATQVKVTDLTNTIWYIPSDWSCSDVETTFNVNFEGMYKPSSHENWSGVVNGSYITLGYDETETISLGDSIITPSCPFYLKITGGEDVTNTSLIAWLSAYGAQLQVTNLTDTAWYVPSGWQAEAGYGQFAITGLYNGAYELGFIDIGYYATDAEENGIDLNGVPHRNTKDFTLNITGGADVQNVALIAWLTAYGIQLKVTDLTNTTWHVPAGWEAEAGYGKFEVDCYNDYGDGNEFYIGYYDSLGMGNATATADKVGIFASGYPISTPSNTNSFTVTFTGGTDVTNTKLIDWLSKYGELQTAETTDIQIAYNGQRIATLAEGQTGVIMCGGKIAATDISIVFGSDGKITYNGVGTLVQAGKTATLVCANKKMASDVVVSVTANKESNATVKITNTSASYTTEVFYRDTADYDLPTIQPNSSATVTVPIGATLFLGAVGALLPAWHTDSISGDCEQQPAQMGKFVISGDCEIVGYAYDAD